MSNSIATSVDDLLCSMFEFLLKCKVSYISLHFYDNMEFEKFLVIAF